MKKEGKVEIIALGVEPVFPSLLLVDSGITARGYRVFVESANTALANERTVKALRRYIEKQNEVFGKDLY